MRDSVLAPLIRASPLLFAQMCLKGPPQPPFYGRLLFSRAQMEWEKIFTTENRYCILASRGSGKTAICTVIHALWRCATEPNGSGYIFSGTEFGAQRILEDIKSEIEKNPKVQWLFPKSKTQKWTATQIRTANGHHLVAKGMLTRVRGAHPSRIFVDDSQTDEDGWSHAKRQKTKEFFFSTITNMVMPGGQIGVVGCVHPDTMVGSMNHGIVPIRTFIPRGSRRKTLHVLQQSIAGKDTFSKTSHFWDNGRQAAQHLTLQGKYEIKCTPRHPVWKMNMSTGVAEWTPIKLLKVGDYVAVRVGAEAFGPDIDLRPMHFQRLMVRGLVHKKSHWNVLDVPDAVTPEMAYLLGLYYSEEHVTKTGTLSIVSVDPCIGKFLASFPLGLKFVFRKMAWRASSRHMMLLMQFLGIPMVRHASKKIIPQSIMSAPKKIVVPFLRGMFDGDGCASVSEKNDLTVSYTTTSQQMAFSVQQILANLGMACTRSSRPPLISPLAVGKHDLHCLNMAGLDAHQFIKIVGFGVKKKRKRYEHLVGVCPRGRLVPGQNVLLKAMGREYQMRSIGGHRKLSQTYAQASKQCGFSIDSFLTTSPLRRYSTGQLRKITAALGMIDDPCAASSSLMSNCRDDLVWKKVESIQKTNCQTYDFVIPKDHSFLANSIVSHNTPMHKDDLLGDLKKNNAYFYAKYPAEDSQGRSTWEDVYSSVFLHNLKKEIGSVRYARERLCEPISDESSLFPRSLFYQHDMMQPHVKMGESAEYWSRLGITSFHIGVDLALSTSVSSDFWVLMVIGVDANKNRWIVEISRDRGLSFSEQKARVVHFSRKYPPEVVIMEANAFQQVAANELKRQTDLPIRAFTTTAQKHSLTDGLPSLRILLENGKYRFPTGDQQSAEKVENFIEEMSNFTWLGGKAQSTGGKDDTAMAAYLTEQGIAKGSRTIVADSDAGVPSDFHPADQAAALVEYNQRMHRQAMPAAQGRAVVPMAEPSAHGGGQLVYRNGVPVRI